MTTDTSVFLLLGRKDWNVSSMWPHSSLASAPVRLRRFEHGVRFQVPRFPDPKETSSRVDFSRRCQWSLDSAGTQADLSHMEKAIPDGSLFGRLLVPHTI